MSNDYLTRAQTLIEALPYIQKYNGKIVVIKYGGNAMISQELREAVMSDIILLSLVGVHVVVVHGGGPEISAMLKKIGKESQFVDGLRYTDEETMDVVQDGAVRQGEQELGGRPEPDGRQGHRSVRPGRGTVRGTGEEPQVRPGG